MSVSPDVREVLLGAADLLERTGWTQGSWARNAHGIAVLPSAGDAVRFCALGALARTRSESTDWWAMIDALHEYVAGADYCSIGRWNDAPERTQAEVVAKLREVAAA